MHQGDADTAVVNDILERARNSKLQQEKIINDNINCNKHGGPRQLTW